MFKMLLFEEVKVLNSLGAEKADVHKCGCFGPLIGCCKSRDFF